MQTRNIYERPVDKKLITGIVTTESPAHVIYRTRKGFAVDLRHAIDFTCPVGTPVGAALEGEVVAVQEGITANYSGNTMPPEDVLCEEHQEGNFVLLRHNGDEFSTYAHLSHVSVTKGQYVKTGEAVGMSGNTGWSSKSHLHFAVFRFAKPRPAKDFESLEIRWAE